MKIQPGQQFKVVECDGHITLVSPDVNVADPSAQPLMIGGVPEVCDYLMAYLSERQLVGSPLKDAHAKAMGYLSARYQVVLREG